MTKLSKNQIKRQALYIKKTKQIYKSKAQTANKRFEKEKEDFVLDLISKKTESVRKRSIGWNCKLIITNKLKQNNYVVNQ